MLQIPKGIRYMMAGLMAGLASAGFLAGVIAASEHQLFETVVGWTSSGAALGLAFWFVGD